jgi:hypothetical protein
MIFDQWLHQDEGFGPRIDRMLDDVKVAVEQERTDDIIKWLMAAYAMGHEQGYDTGHYDGKKDCKEHFDEYGWV